MIDEPEPLVVLLSLVEGIPLPPEARRDLPDLYADHLILKGLVVMLVRRAWQAHGVRALLSEPSPQTLRGRFPSRRTWERRLDRLAGVLPPILALLGTWSLCRLARWPHGSQAVAIDSTCLHAGWGLAQEPLRGGRSAPYQYRHRGGLDQVGLARLDVRLEAACREVAPVGWTDEHQVFRREAP